MKLALAGDTMLGRRVGQAVAAGGPRSLVSDEVVELAREADLFVLNLECCVSKRGARWPDPHKPFHFRAPPAAIETLVHLGVDCVTLANNHALDYGEQALLDTLEHLRTAGIAVVGAGEDEERARAPVVLEANGVRVGVVAVSDHPADFAAGARRPGIAFADLWEHQVPKWLLDSVAGIEAELVVVTPHWGPNMTTEPPPHVRAAAAAFREAGATLVAGHSAHVFHGVEPGVLFDLGDFLDDYVVDPRLRNDLGLLFLVTFDGGSSRVEAVPLKLDYCRTRLAEGEDAEWIRARFRSACAALGTRAHERDGRLVVESS